MNSASSRKSSSAQELVSRINADTRRRRAIIEGKTEAALLDESRARCQSLHGFIKEAWHVLEPGTPFVDNWHIRTICDLLEAVTAGRITRLLINVPPGMMKSLLVGVLWPAWEWTKRPELRYFTTSYIEEYATRDARKMRDLVSSAWYQTLWGDKVRLTRFGESSFENTARGNREAVPIASMTAGRGDRVIIDDPHSIDTAESETDRLKTTKRFRESVTTRVNDAQASVIIVVMQRIHATDLSGTILELGGYVHLMLPMEFEPERRCVIPEIGFADPRTGRDELLFPERFTRATVDRDKKTLGSYAVAGQYQQRPAPREGGNFKRHWFKIVRAVPAGGRYARAWDLGATKDGGDYTVGVLMKIVLGAVYIIDVVRFRGSPAEVETAIKNTAAQDAQLYGGKAVVRIRLPQDPGQAGKAQAATHAKLLQGYVFRSLTVTGDKETRSDPLAAQAEAGNVNLLEAPWNVPFIDELGMFPGGANDDQVDAAADAYNELVATGGSGQNVVAAPIIVTGQRPGV